jgi:hypothetical protein
MQLLVGTLHTIENEFEECLKSLSSQSFNSYKHIVISGLPNREAHEKLYKTFMSNSNEFDLYLKLDADMVLLDTELFSNVVRKFQKNSYLKDLEIAVFDFFSDQLIWGLHFYRNTVKWNCGNDDLFVDDCPVNPNERIQDDSVFAPAAVHCKNPSVLQSFHYGVHKALKILQPNRLRFRKDYAGYHWNILARTRKNYIEKGDIRLGFVLLGAELVFCGGIYPTSLDYSNPNLNSRFEHYKNLSKPDLDVEIHKLERKSFGFLPGRARFALLLLSFRFRN